MKIVLMGEPMGLYIAEEPGPLDQVKRFSQAIAGAEYNVAVGLARLGHTPIYCTAVGGDPMGRDILRGLEANGIGTQAVRVSGEAPTGYMKKSLAQGRDPEIGRLHRRLHLRTWTDWIFPAASGCMSRGFSRRFLRAPALPQSG